MTILGPDLSSYQSGLDVGALPYPFVLAKATEGTYYDDASYAAWRLQALAAGKHFIAYHFISGEDPHDQAEHLATHIVDQQLPVMLDFEPTGTYRPTLAQLLAVADAMTAIGLRVRLAYVPRWYWAQIGQPDLTPLASRGIALVSSAYPGGSGYPGDDAAGWSPYGGLTPALYQYTSSAPIQGRAVDMNAFRGGIDELDTLLYPTTHQENPVATIPDSIAHHFADLDLSGDFPPNGSFTVEGAAIWADARAEAAYRKAAENGGKLDQLLALVAKIGTPPPAPAPDVDALAAALAPKLAAGATADEIAHAVLMHLGADLTAPTAS